MAEPIRCTGCGQCVDSTVRRIVDPKKRVIVRCGLCPKKRYALSENDRRMLRDMRIKGD